MRPTHKIRPLWTLQTLTHALYHVAENPGDLQALREEIETAISADGGGCQWTSTALGNMWKLDSLFRETLRFHGVGTRKHTPPPDPQL